MEKVLVTAAMAAMIGGGAAAEYTVKGSLDCTAAVEEDSHKEFREYNKWWLLGYFTGRNYSSDKQTGHGLEDENIYQIALSFCKSNLKNDWDDAAIHTYDLLD